MHKGRGFSAFLLKAVGACMLVGFIFNALMFAYNRQPGWIERSGGATMSIWNPGTYIVQGQEGYGIHAVDEKGYLNYGELVSSDYVLVVGSSQTEGKEVKAGERYCDILNVLLREEEGLNSNDLLVYNVSMDANYLPKIIPGFTALITEFPNSRCIVFEIGTTCYSEKEIDQMLSQRKYNENEAGENIGDYLSKKEKIKLFIKETIPLLNQIKMQYNALRSKNGDDTETKYEETALNEQEYVAQLKEVFDLLSGMYSGQIVFLYHPSIEITNEGIMVNYENTKEVFEKTCSMYDFQFVDMTEVFIDAYKTDYLVPYGFSNTTLGTGHLNKYGHKMIAEELYHTITKKK